MTCEMRQAFLNKYALMDQKRERVGVDVRRELDVCVIIEYNVMARTSMEYLDSMLRCLARLQDSHLDMHPLLARPFVYAGVVLGERNGRFYILRRAESLFEYLAKLRVPKSKLDKLAIGREVIQIDGAPVADVVAEMRRYISASSSLYRLQKAAEAVLARNFAYPKKPKVKLTMISGETIELPWFHAASTNMFATQEFRTSAIQSLSNLALKDGMGWQGYSPSYTLINEEDIRERHLDDNGEESLIMGRQNLGGKMFCYIQLKTFHTQNWRKLGSNQMAAFEIPIQEFVRSCEDFGVPLVLDLRSNGGGYTSNAAKLNAVLAREGSVLPGTLFAYRGSMHSLLLLQTHMAQGQETPAHSADDMSDDERSLLAVKEALESRQPYTQIIRSAEITPSENVGGFNQKLVVLVSPFCVSACEIAAAHLKYSNRAQLIGQPTSGTGAGFHKDNEIDSTWKAASYDAFQVKIPNLLFGVAQERFQDPLLSFEDHKKWLMENRPITPHVVFSPEPRSYHKANAEWIRVIAESL
jgi:hypothetical protein